MTSKLTLQINSMEALERLIGGDSEVEVDIRNSVAQAFSAKYLKSLTKDQAKTQISSYAHDQITKELKAIIGEGCYDVKLTEAAKKKIRNTAEEAIADIVQTHFLNIKGKIDDLVEKSVSAAIKKEIAAIIAPKKMELIEEITKKLGF